MTSSDDHSIELLNNIITSLYLYVVPVYYIVGNLGNLVSAYVFWKRSWRKKVCVFYFNIYLLFSSCFINSYLLGSIFVHGYNTNTLNSSVLLCKLFYYTGFLFSTLPPTVLILASIDRLLISSQNVDTRLYSSKRLAYFSISTGTLFWTVYFIHVLFRYNIQKISSSTFVCLYDSSPWYIQFTFYSSLLIDCLFSSTMIILVLVSLKNVRRLRAIPRQQRHQIRSMTKKDFQLLRCLFVQDMVYIVSTIFLSICLAYEAATKDRSRKPVEQVIHSFVINLLTFTGYLPFCASFGVFLCVSKAFRNEVKRLVYKAMGTDLPVTRVEEKEAVDNTPKRDDLNQLELNVFSVS